MEASDPDTIQVAIRIRPLNPVEARESFPETIHLCQTSTSPKEMMVGRSHSFYFDHIFTPSNTQADIFKDAISPLISKFIQGYNVTILAYGQTGSGKTFTMGINLDETAPDSLNSAGIVPRSMDMVFQKIDRTSEIHVSFIEIYNEEVRDLLVDKGGKGRSIRIREDASGEIYLVGSSEVRIDTPEDVHRCLRRGMLHRMTASTNMNLTSSRSHAILSVYLRQKNGDTDAITTSTLNFVDLAGSERMKRTQVVGTRAKESISINSGLLALGNVIAALSIGNSKLHIPYRNSKLTRLLQNSLGGNSYTLMIACVSPYHKDILESTNTLKYASRAKTIQNTAHINTNSEDKLDVLDLRKQVMELKQELLLQKTQTGKIVDMEEISKIVEENVRLKSIVDDINMPEQGGTFRDRLVASLSKQVVEYRSRLLNLEMTRAVFDRVQLTRLVLNLAKDMCGQNTFDVDMARKIDEIHALLEDAKSQTDQMERLRAEHTLERKRYEDKIQFLQNALESAQHEREVSRSAQLDTRIREKYEARIRRLSKEVQDLRAQENQSVAGNMRPSRLHGSRIGRGPE